MHPVIKLVTPNNTNNENLLMVFREV
jgi:hypothetical protein